MMAVLSSRRVHLILTASLMVFAVAPAAAQDFAFEPLPPPPPFDGAPIEGGEAKDAAVRAIGPLASEFVDHVANSPLFMGPQDIWVGKFLTKPRLAKPGLCVERMLIVPLRLSKSSNGAGAWQPHNVRWIDETRIVGAFEEEGAGTLDPKQEAACADLLPFKEAYTFGLFQADSVEEAWRAGRVLQNLILAARAKAKLGFALECKPGRDKVCRMPRRSLANLKFANLWSASPCDGESHAKDCLKLAVETTPNPSRTDWWLTVRLAGPNSTAATAVTMEYQVEPVI